MSLVIDTTVGHVSIGPNDINVLRLQRRHPRQSEGLWSVQGTAARTIESPHAPEVSVPGKTTLGGVVTTWCDEEYGLVYNQPYKIRGYSRLTKKEFTIGVVMRRRPDSGETTVQIASPHLSIIDETTGTEYEPGTHTISIEDNGDMEEVLGQGGEDDFEIEMGAGRDDDGGIEF